MNHAFGVVTHIVVPSARRKLMKTVLFAITAATLLSSAEMTAVAQVLTAPVSGRPAYAAPSQVAGKAGTITALASLPNPPCFGQPVTLTASVTPVVQGSGFPTGTVDFEDG